MANNDNNSYLWILAIAAVVLVMLAYPRRCRFECSSGSSERFPSGANGLDSTTRLAAGGVAGPITWAPALRQAQGIDVPSDYLPPGIPSKWL